MGAIRCRRSRAFLVVGLAAAAVAACSPSTLGESLPSARAPGSAAAGTAAFTLAPAPGEPAAVALASAPGPERGDSGFGSVAGLLTFRGNPTRTYYGQGPVPRRPAVDWTYPAEGGLCGMSSEGGQTTSWCGTGWTGQPAVWERDGRTLVAFGAYDHHLHVLDAATGRPVADPFPTGDLIKGSVTVDPDGFPLIYVGSRDDRFRIVAFDRPQLTELWSMSADDVSPTMWNDDWDSSALVVGDRLIEGGENGQLHVVDLNRGYGPDGLATVAPELVFNTPGWDDELLADFGGTAVSIESSVALHDGVVYFANSAGLVQGWDLRPLEADGRPVRTFRFWTGDDTDASVVIDPEGQLYVASEYERANERSRQVGQLMRLDPSRPDDPLVWSIDFHEAVPDGLWATPALHGDLLVGATNSGALVGVDRRSGQLRWRKQLPGPTWQSPVIVDDVLIEGDCAGFLHGFDLRDPTVEPPPLWTVELGGCIESTPAVWKGRIYVGTRAGRFFALAGR